MLHAIRPSIQHRGPNGTIGNTTKASVEEASHAHPDGHQERSTVQNQLPAGVRLRTMDSSSREQALSQGASSEPTLNDNQGSSGGTGAGQSLQTGSAMQSRSAVQTAIASDSAGLEAARSAVETNLTQLASDPEKFHQTLTKSFGDSYDKTRAETIRQQVLSGDFSWMPDIKVVDESVLADQSGQQTAGQALGAYSKDADTIYISRQLLLSDPAKAAQILTEEVGHSLDARLNQSDAAGDEGDIFARLVGGESISDAELLALQSENDSGTIIVDGKTVEVEYGFLSNIGKAVTGAAKGVLGAAKSVVEGVGTLVKTNIGFVRDAHKALGSALKSVASAAGKFGGALLSPLLASVQIFRKGGLNKLWNDLKTGFEKLMNNKLFNQILMVAQFIPIPVVQLVVRGINMAKAAYALYQGVKHGSIGHVLSGVAGVAGGVGSFGQLLGASDKFVNVANRISSMADKGSQVYAAVAEKDFAAAASLAKNFFAGESSASGAAPADKTTGSGVSDSAKALRESSRNTVASGAASLMESSATELEAPSRWDSLVAKVKGNETYKAIVDNVSTIRDVVSFVKEGDYQGAAETFLGSYADDLGIGKSTQATIVKWAGAMAEAYQDRSDDNNSSSQAVEDQTAARLGLPMTQENRALLGTAFSVRDAILELNFSDASRASAAICFQSDRTDLASTFLRVGNLLDGKLQVMGDVQLPGVSAGVAMA